MTFHIHKFAARTFVFAASLLVAQCLTAEEDTNREVRDVGLIRLEKGVQRIAAEVAKLLHDQNETTINVGDFTAPPRLKASGGTGVRQAVINALKLQRIDTRDDARLQLIGEFSDAVNQASGGAAALRVAAKILDDKDTELDRFSIAILGVAGLQMTGGTAELPPQLDEPKRHQIQNERLHKPQAAIVGSETRAETDSPYGVEVLVANNSGSTSRIPTIVAGRPYVELNKGEKYVVRLHNRSAHDAAVLLTIDGLSTFAFSKEGNFAAQFIVPPGQVVDVTGWYFSKDEARAFLLTSYPDSAVGQKGIPTANVGVITATFAAAWDPTQGAPIDEPPRIANAKDANSFTGIGGDTGQKFKLVQRKIGCPRSVISVRYNRD